MKKILIFIASLFIIGSIKAEDIIYQNVGPFGGLNNTDSAIAIPANKAQDLLNVEVSPSGKSVIKRRGYALFSNLSISTSAVHGVHNFYDASGNSIDLYFNDTRISASVGGGAVYVLSSTGSLNATWQCVDSQGFAYCNNTGRTSLLKTNGQTFSYINNVNSTGTMVAVTDERLVTSGFAEATNRIDFSKANDFTSWTIGSAATSAAQFTVVAPGSRITHIVYAFGKVIWFKDSSMGYIYVGQAESQADWEVKIIDPRVGTLDNTSVYWEGVLYFRGQDGHIYGFDGSSVVKLTRDLQSTIQLSGNRTTNSWSQSSQTDFETSSMTPAGYLSTTLSAGSIVLGTATAISDFVDDSSSDFGSASSVVNVDTKTISGSVLLSTASVIIAQQSSGGSGHSYISYLDAAYQSFVASTTGNFTRLQIFGDVTGSPGTQNIYLLDDNNLKPGATIYTASFDFNTVNSTGSWARANVSSPVKVTSGNRYWVGTTIFGNPSTYFRYETRGILNGYNGDPSWSPSAGGLNTTNTEFIIDASTYTSSGYLVSRAFDNGFSTNSWIWEWGNYYASGTVPSGTSLSYRTQTSSDSSCSSCWSSEISVSSGSSPTSLPNRYFRYVSSFTSVDTSTSPILNYVEQNMSSRLRPGGTYYSQVRNIGSTINAWDTFSVTKQENDGSLSFYIRASSTNIGINSSTPAWTSVSAGSIPGISTNSYVQLKTEFLVSKSTQNPTLNDFTISWVEGSASDKAYATYFNDAIWWSVPVGVSVSSNTRILRLDLLNNDWYIYDIGTNGMLVRNNALYFGSSSLGKIYKFGDVDNDDGVAINSYWKSKDFVLGNPFVKKEFVNLSVSAGSVSNSTMTVTYTIDGSSSTSYSYPLYAGSSNSYRNFNKNLPLGKIGSTFNIQFGNNGSDQPLEVFAVQYGFRDKPWVPTP